MKKGLLIIFLSFNVAGLAQGVGINSTGTVPHVSALLHVDLGTSQSKGFLVTGVDNSNSTIPNLGAGSRLMFYPGKAAFRAGYVDGTQWNFGYVGQYSVAMGESTMASGSQSTAIGYLTNASGPRSTAMGDESIASGGVSIAMGYRTNARGNSSTAMGFMTNAFGNYSTTMGNLTTASGLNSTAMGYFTNASGIASTAIGNNTIASGDNSFAAGARVSTNNHAGAFFFGDGDPYNKGVRSIGFNDQFAARFNGGYYFISSNAGADVGVQVLAGGNAWVAMCDENRKENFEPLNGDDILQKIKDIKFSSWNYKTQDPKVHRHYGIMAQDFNNAFGKDTYGAIGNDTTVNPIDMIGIDMAAIQALEKRTAVLSQENKDLKNEMNELKLRLAKLEKQ